MHILVLAEHDGTVLRPASLSALAFAQEVAQERGAPAPRFLLLGNQIRQVAEDAARFAPVQLAESPALATSIAEHYAPILAAALRDGGEGMLVAASTSLAKDVLGRAGGLLGGTMASDVVGHAFVDGQLRLERPICAGAAIATIALHGPLQIVTVRASAYRPAVPAGSSQEISTIEVDESAFKNRVKVVAMESTTSSRPDVTEASIVVSGGRALKNSDDFERLVGGLADVLEGATGSSRALVDAGITPNELQVGQTGKIVAPEIYIALGISGAVQHLAGMKNSRIVIAINNDPAAPIFEEADYGLVGDVYEVVPELIKACRENASAAQG